VQVHQLQLTSTVGGGGEGEVAFDAGDVPGDLGGGLGGVLDDPCRFVGVGVVVVDLLRLGLPGVVDPGVGGERGSALQGVQRPGDACLAGDGDSPRVRWRLSTQEDESHAGTEEVQRGAA
jgi:hypothetical protein